MDTATREIHYEILPFAQEHHTASLDSVVLCIKNIKHYVQYHNILCSLSNGSLLASFFPSHLSLSPQARGESVGIASLLLSAG